MKRVKVLIEVRGGNVVAIYAENLPGLVLDVEIQDHDNIAAGDADETPAAYDELATTKAGIQIYPL